MAYGDRVKAGLDPSLRLGLDIGPESMLTPQRVESPLLQCSLAVGVSAIRTQVAGSVGDVGFLHGTERSGRDLTFHFLETKDGLGAHHDLAMRVGLNRTDARNGVGVRLSNAVTQDTRVACLYGPGKSGPQLLLLFREDDGSLKPERTTADALATAVVRSIGARVLQRSGQDWLHLTMGVGFEISDCRSIKQSDIGRFVMRTATN